MSLAVLAVSATNLPAGETPAASQPGAQAAMGLYSEASGYGFEPVVVPAGPNKIQVFSAKLAEGTYGVTLSLGHPTEATTTTVKAESGRLMLENVKTAAGETITRTFLVRVSSPAVPGGKSVSLKPGEVGSRTWDDKLTLEFIGPQLGIQKIAITPVEKALTVYIAGDSTVTDQGGMAYAGWGQMLPRFLAPDVVVANYAQSGASLASFRGRLEKILSTLRPGDYVLIQFGHNDQKAKNYGAPGYKADLEKYVSAIKAKGGIPLLVTSVYRRRFDGAKLQDSLGEFPPAVRQVAQEQHVTLIDLHKMSGTLFQTLGKDGSRSAFVHYPPNTFPGQTEPLKDDSHFSAYGAYELSRCIIETIRTSDLALAKHLAEDVKPFDPAKPDPIGSIQIPASASRPTTRPEGS